MLATGHAAQSDDRPDWAALANTGQPIVIYMGLTNAGRRRSPALIAGRAGGRHAGGGGRARHAAGRAAVVATLGTLVGDGGEGERRRPALIVIGAYRLDARRSSGRRMTARGDHHRRAALGLGQDLSVTIGLLRALKRRGVCRARREIRAGLYRPRLSMRRQPGIPGVNLDSWAMPPGAARRHSSPEQAESADDRGDRERHGPVRRHRRPRQGRSGSAADLARLLSACRCCWCSTCRASRRRRRPSAKGFAVYDPAVQASPASCSTGWAANGIASWQATRSRRSACRSSAA